MSLRHYPCLFWLLLLPIGSLFPAPSSWAMAVKPQEKIAPDFPRHGVWIQTLETITNKIFKNHLTLLYFWDYTSANCLRDLTYLKKWEGLYKPYGLQILLVHSPEFEFAAKKENVEQAVRYYKIPYPVLLDNQFKLWEAYKNFSWPTKVLINPEGRIIHTQAGEGKYQEMENMLRGQLGKMDSRMVLPNAFVEEDEPDNYNDEECGPMMGETYIGHKRARWWGAEIANKNWTKSKATSIFKDRGERVQRGFFLQGLWTNFDDYFEHARQTQELADYLGIVYFGSSVYSVMSLVEPLAGEARVYVTRDDQPVPSEFRGKDLKEDEKGKTYVPLKEARLYHLIVNEDEGPHEIKVWTREKGVAVSSFSFANRCLSTVDLLGS
ncbi:MAG: redoxin domain-containing protein [Candidatus Omnitrophica bacterium]|nr:redoxin domain-containing protein [Candidatus Omnitrophota bacterium]